MASDFLTTYAPLANDIATRTGLDPAVVLGIIDTETGGGVHVKGNNIFGISPSGPRGQYVASYPDVQTASQAFISLIQTPRYRGVTASSDPAAQAVALVRGGYNTANPNYAAIVANKAKAIGSQLGYQDGDGASQPPPVAMMATSAQPAAAPAPAAAPVGSYSFPAPGAAPASTPTAAPAPAGSEKDKALADPALAGGDTGAVPAQAPAAPPAATAPKSAKDQALSDPALAETKSTAPPPATTGTSLADVISSPEAQGADIPAVSSPTAPGATMPSGGNQWPTREEMLNALEPAPNTIYGSPLSENLPMGGNPFGAMLSPFARDATTEETRLTLPPMIRATLQGLVGGIDNALTFNPSTGTYGLTPEAQAVAGFGATGLRFGTPRISDAARIQARVTETRDAGLPPEMTAPLTAGEQTQLRDRGYGTSDIEKLSPAEARAVLGGPKPGADGISPAGAQVTPSYEAIHTPAEEAAYRANAEGQKLIEGQKLGEPDLNQYIPGETVNNAQREQTAKAARELKELGIRVPEASQMEKLAEESNDTARKVYTQNTSKGPIEITNRRTVRETDIKADKTKVFAPDNVTAPVDFQPVVEQMEAVLRAPENRQNSALQSVYREQLERIKAAKIEDPAEAWGLRRDLDRLTDKRMAAKDPNLHYVAHHLDDVANLIDIQIEKVAPGYSDMLAKYKEHSRAINEMEVLQGALDKLRGPGQKLTYNDFQRFMKNVVDSRMTPSHDLNAFKAISEENMQRLWNIRDSLRRTASAKELASAAGSDTMPNIIDALKAVGKMGGTAALHAYVGAHLGPGGNLALQSLSAVGKSLNDRRMIRRTMRQMNQLLRPSEPLRVPPGQENPLSGAPPP